MPRVPTAVLACLTGALAFMLLYCAQRLALPASSLLTGCALTALMGGCIGFLGYCQWRRTGSTFEHLTLLLHALRNINELIFQDTNPRRVIEGACDGLTRTGAYASVWIALTDARGDIIPGLASRSPSLPADLRQNTLPACGQRALAQPGVMVLENPAACDANCPFRLSCTDRQCMVLRIEHHDRIFGVMAATLPRRIPADEYVRGLFRTAGSEIALALHYGELEHERQRTRRAIEHHMEELFAVFNNIEGLLYVVDMQTDTLLATNRHCEELYGPDLIGRKCYEVFHTNQHTPCSFCTRSRLTTADNTPGPAIPHDVWHTRTGNWYNSVSKAVHWPDGRLVHMEIGIDITQRKQAEDALAESEKAFRDLVEKAKNGILIYQHDRIVYRNPQQERMFGPVLPTFTLSEYKGIHPQDREKVKTFYRAVRDGRTPDFECDVRYYPPGPDGSTAEMKWVICRATRIEFRGQEAMLITVTDITRFRELEHLVRVQDKMASLGRVAAGIAHEIRNPLSGINLQLKSLERIYADPAEVATAAQIIAQIEKSSRKIESVIRRVMDFSHPGRPRLTPLDINLPVREALNLSEVSLRKQGILLTADLTDNLPPVSADSSMIEEVVMNFLTNAADALQHTDREKHIHVATACGPAQLEITVADSGPGVPDHLRESIFDPFYTTKNDSSGIGLSLSSRIVHDHGGRIRIETSHWGGAAFTITLPLAHTQDLP